MGNEIKSLIKVWITVYASLTFCYYIIRKIPPGKLRLMSLLPIISLFAFLPLKLSSIHFVGITSFLITWLCNFKLILFSFNQGPLSSNPSISLIHFISLACLHIKIQQYPSLKPSKNGLKSPYNYSIKLLILALVIYSYNYKHFMHPNLILALYCIHVYLAAEIALAIIAAPAHALGLEIEPQFNEPYLSTSLQDFWGRRWNLMVPSILRPTIYDPTRRISTRIFGRKYALPPAVIATFVVSGLMHELIYYYETRVAPTWEVTWFFVLHGVVMVLEILTKRAVAGKWQLHRVVSGPLVIGFVGITGFWLFFPQLVRNGVDVKAIKEYSLLIDFVKEK